MMNMKEDVALLKWLVGALFVSVVIQTIMLMVR